MVIYSRQFESYESVLRKPQRLLIFYDTKQSCIKFNIVNYIEM